MDRKRALWEFWRAFARAIFFFVLVRVRLTGFAEDHPLARNNSTNTEATRVPIALEGRGDTTEENDRTDFANVAAFAQTDARTAKLNGDGRDGVDTFARPYLLNPVSNLHADNAKVISEFSHTYVPYRKFAEAREGKS